MMKERGGFWKNGEEQEWGEKGKKRNGEGGT